MLRLDSFRRRMAARRERGQGLVEFSLTIMVFLLLVVMIVEVGRMLWAYVTLQQAVRSAARYAVTGQWLQEYADDLTAGYDPSDPSDLMKHIPPCWPLFEDDPYPLTDKDRPPRAYDAYQPYRNPRSCSVEAAALRVMRPLPANPLAGETEPGYYRVRIAGVAPDKYPTEGTFTRLINGNPSIHDYANYFDLPAHTGSNFGWSPGFAGMPEQTVAVRAELRLPLLTPLLRNIAPSVMLRTTALMTNESFGSLGAQRAAMLPPEVPDVSPFEPLLPPDLIVTRIDVPGMFEPGSVPSIFVAVRNAGSIEAPAGFVVNLYAVPEGSGFSEGGLIASATVGAPLPATASLAVPMTITPLTSGRYDFYARVDATDVIDEVGAGEDTNPQGESNNTYQHPTVVLVGSVVNLYLEKSVDNNTPAVGDELVYSFAYGNTGFSPATAVTVTDTLPPGVTYVSSTPGGICSGTPLVCNLNNVAAGGSGSFEVTVRLDGAAAGERLTNTATIEAQGGDELDSNLADNTSSVDVVVEGVNVLIDAEVDNDEPDPEDEVVFTVTVENDSPNDASGVSVSTDFDAGIDYLSDDGGGAYDPGSGAWTLGALPAGETLTLHITARVSATDTDPFAEFALEPRPENVNTDLVQRVQLFVRRADLTIRKSVTPRVASATEEVRYTVTVTNTGPADATGFTVVDTLPPNDESAFGVEFVSAQVSGGAAAYDGAAHTVTWVWGPDEVLPDGASATLEIVAIVAEEALNGEMISNIAAITETAQYDPNSNGENTSGAVLEVGNAADLVVTGGVSVAGAGATSSVTAAEGQNIVYTLNVRNNGPTPAQRVVVTDAVAMGLLEELSGVSGVPDYDDSDPENPLGLAPDGTWHIGPIGIGQTRTLQISGTVAPRSDRQTFNWTAAAAFAHPDDPVELDASDNSAAFEVELTDELADVRLSITPASAERKYKEAMEWTVTIRNDGPDGATGIVVDLASLANLETSGVLESVSYAPSAGTWSATNRTWTIDSLAAGGSVTFTISGTVADLSAASGPQTYTGTVAANYPLPVYDPTRPTANWSFTSKWVDPAYYNVGPAAGSCSAVTWGNPAGGLQNGHPLIGQDVVWQIRTPADINSRSDEPVYAPVTPDYPTTGQGTELADGDAGLFQCLAAANQSFPFEFDLMPGRWRVILLMFPPGEAGSFTVTGNGTTLFPDGRVSTAAGDDNVYYITDGTVTVPADGALTINVGAKGTVSGIGLEYLGP